jgi:hypothetical protein
MEPDGIYKRHASQFFFGGAVEVIVSVLVAPMFGYSVTEVVLLNAPGVVILVISGYAFMLFSLYLHICGDRDSGDVTELNDTLHQPENQSKRP